MKANNVHLLVIAVLVISVGGFLNAQGRMNLSESADTESWAPRLTVDSNGNIHVVWWEKGSGSSGNIYYRGYSLADQSWTDKVNLSNSGSVRADTYRTCGIASDEFGNVFAIWIEGNNVKLRSYISGKLGEVQTIGSSRTVGDHPRICAYGNGNLCAVWMGADGNIYARARVDGIWEDQRVISYSGKRSKFPDVSVGGSSIGACWMQRAGEGYTTAYSHRGTGRNASWSAIQTPTQGIPVYEHEVPVLEMSSTGTPNIVWAIFVNGPRIVQHCYGTGNYFSTPQDISRLFMLHNPSIYRKDSTFYACWQMGSIGNGLGVNYATYSGGTWSEEKSLANSKGCSYPDIAVSLDGTKLYFVFESYGEVYFTDGTPGGDPPTPTNITPIADFSFTPETGESPVTITFDASVSNDPDGKIVSYAWNFGDGTLGKGVKVNHTFTRHGQFSIKLTVTDDDDAKGVTTKDIIIIKPNVLPVANFTYSPRTGFYPLYVSFDASSSYDPDGNIVKYAWTFGDGGASSNKVVGHTYNKWGTYTINMSVTDDRGGQITKNAIIKVLRLYQPLNIRWATRTDQSLFLTRYVTDVNWDRNPANDEIAAIVKYRVYRKGSTQSDLSYKCVAELAGNVLIYRDTSVEGVNLYAYTVTSVDAAGHESPINAANSNTSQGTSSIPTEKIKKPVIPRRF